MTHINLFLRNHGWTERRAKPRHTSPYKLASDWRSNTMAMLLIGAGLPIRNPYLIAVLLTGFALMMVFIPRVANPQEPLKAVIPNHCNDPDISWWHWIADGCWMLATKVKLWRTV